MVMADMFGRVPGSNISDQLRKDLLDITGVDIYLLREQSMVKLNPVEQNPLRYVWKRDAYKCRFCGAGWEAAKLGGHHLIPLRLGKSLGLPRQQFNHESNLVVLWEDCHNEKDNGVAELIRTRYPEIWKDWHDTPRRGWNKGVKK